MAKKLALLGASLTVIATILGILAAFEVTPRFWAWADDLRVIAGDLYSDQIIRAKRERRSLEEEIARIRARREKVPERFLKDLVDLEELIKSLEAKRRKQG